jgi:hypothetical protein
MSLRRKCDDSRRSRIAVVTSSPGRKNCYVTAVTSELCDNAVSHEVPRVFLLSPARLREGVSVGEVFAFVSALDFRK